MTLRSSSLNRKGLKKLDPLTGSLRSFWGKLSKSSNLVGSIAVSLVLIGIASGLYVSRRDSKASAARNALFEASKVLNEEMKSLENLEATQAMAQATAKATSVPSKETAKPAEAVAVKKLDVDKQLAKSAALFKVVDSNFGNTRAAFEARFELAELYFNHGEFKKALPWYEKALDSAPNNFEKASILSALGYTQENLGDFKEAIRFFNKALDLGEGSLKGDLLLGIARSYESLHDVANARSTYDKILSQLPGTEHAKSADLLKTQI